MAIQFRVDPNVLERERKCIGRETGKGVGIDYIEALDAKIDWNFPEVILAGYSGVILGGSGDLDFDGSRDENDEVRLLAWELVGRLRPLFQYIFDKDLPTLGICFGHQIFGAFAGAQVHCDALQKKTASHPLRLLVDKNDYFLFSELPETFHANYGHKDVLDRVPKGAVLLMDGGERCKVSALQYKNNIYTLQFHPELNYLDMVERIKSSKGYLPEGAVIEEVFKDEPYSNTILKNFVKFVEMKGVIN